MKPAEILLYDYLSDAITAAVFGDVLYEIELHDTVYQKIGTHRGIRISEASGDMVPDVGGGLKEWDVNIPIVCYSRVEGTDWKARQPALLAMFAIQQAVYKLLLADESLGGRVCNIKINPAVRGYDVWDGKAFAAANIPVVINPST